MDSTSHLHNTLLQTTRALASTIKFVQQIFDSIAGESFVFVKIDFFFYINFIFLLIIFFLQFYFIFIYFCVFLKKKRKKNVRVFLSLLKFLENLVSVRAIEHISFTLNRTCAHLHLLLHRLHAYA
jgi:hypothetical protein